MRPLIKMMFGVLLVSQLLGCGDGNRRQSATSPAGNDSAAAAPQKERAEKASVPRGPSAAPQQSNASLPDPLRGKVKETMNAGGYTYVLLAAEQGDIWAAARQFAVAAGDEVEVASFMPMVDFHSASLERTFDVIQFAGRAQVVGGSAAGGPASGTAGASAPLPPGHPSIGDAGVSAKSGEATPPKPGEIETLADGVTVESLFVNKADLDGKTVKLRGRVVKANRGILGRNWLHVQDGTGGTGTNDITITSQTGYAAPGALVTIEGTLGLDKDFGAGYVYGVIVEDAKVVVEPTSDSD